MIAEVLAAQERAAECATVVTPVPKSAIWTGEFVPLLVTVTLPVTIPVAAGANVTVKVAVWPADMMSPAGTPLATKPAPDMPTFEMVTFEVPRFVNVTFWWLLLDMATLPKSNERVPAFTVSVASGTKTMSRK